MEPSDTNNADTMPRKFNLRLTPDNSAERFSFESWADQTLLDATLEDFAPAHSPIRREIDFLGLVEGSLTQSLIELAAGTRNQDTQDLVSVLSSYDGYLGVDFSQSLLAALKVLRPYEPIKGRKAHIVGMEGGKSPVGFEMSSESWSSERLKKYQDNMRFIALYNTSRNQSLSPSQIETINLGLQETTVHAGIDNRELLTAIRIGESLQHLRLRTLYMSQTNYKLNHLRRTTKPRTKERNSFDRLGHELESINNYNIGLVDAVEQLIDDFARKLNLDRGEPYTVSLSIAGRGSLDNVVVNGVRGVYGDKDVFLVTRLSREAEQLGIKLSYGRPLVLFRSEGDEIISSTEGQPKVFFDTTMEGSAGENLSIFSIARNWR